MKGPKYLDQLYEMLGIGLLVKPSPLQNVDTEKPIPVTSSNEDKTPETPYVGATSKVALQV